MGDQLEIQWRDDGGLEEGREGGVSIIHTSLAWTTKHVVIHSLNIEYRRSTF